MKKAVFAITVLSFLLTACSNSDTTNEKEILKANKTEDVTAENTNPDNNTSGTDSVKENNTNSSDSTKGNLEDTLNSTTNKSIATSTKKETTTAPSPNASTNESLKEKYLKKLDNAKVELENRVFDDGTTSLLAQAEYDRYDHWDNLLNEIYGVLKSQLSASEMEQLKIKQREWITYRDKKAAEESSPYRGNAAEWLAHGHELANQTEIRCYTLVNEYMK